MELQTELHHASKAGKLYSYVLYGEPRDVTRLLHDAAAAHALIRSIHEFASYGNQDDGKSILERAEAILINFGLKVNA